MYFMYKRNYLFAIISKHYNIAQFRLVVLSILFCPLVPIKPSEVKVEYYSSYPGLSCTTENQLIVMEMLNRAVDLVLSRICNSGTPCYLEGVTVQGCPGVDGGVPDNIVVTKVVSFIINYDTTLGTC